MNPKPFSYHDAIKRDTFERLKEEFDDIEDKIRFIENLDVSEESKKPILDDLQEKLNEIKERMHNYIDTL